MPGSGSTSPQCGPVVTAIESSQLDEVPIQTQHHEEACILTGQLSMLGLIVQDPRAVYLGVGACFQADSHAIMKLSPTEHTQTSIR